MSLFFSTVRLYKKDELREYFYKEMEVFNKIKFDKMYKYKYNIKVSFKRYIYIYFVRLRREKRRYYN